METTAARDVAESLEIIMGSSSSRGRSVVRRARPVSAAFVTAAGAERSAWNIPAAVATLLAATTRAATRFVLEVPAREARGARAGSARLAVSHRPKIGRAHV